MRSEGRIITRVLCITALALWAITIVGIGWLFVAGWTRPGTDARAEVILAPAERDVILGEMRQLLKSVHGVVTGLSAEDDEDGRKEAEQAARAAGMGMAADVNPSVMVKLPVPFKQMGMSVHRDFDALAEIIAGGAQDREVLSHLSSITSRCTTCHELYRLSVTP